MSWEKIEIFVFFHDKSQTCRTVPGIQHVLNKYLLNELMNIIGKFNYYGSLYLLTLLVKNSKHSLNQLKQQQQQQNMTFIAWIHKHPKKIKGLYSENEALSRNCKISLSASHFFLFSCSYVSLFSASHRINLFTDLQSIIMFSIISKVPDITTCH